MSAELLRALNTRSLSAEDRLKVACYLWKQEGPQLSANKAVLAKWIGDEICSAYGKKVRTRPPPGVRCKLWQFLSLVLCTGCQNEGEFQPSITTHLLQCMSEVCTEVCSPDGDEVLQCARNMLKCLESILLLSPCPAVLYKYELMVSLLVSLMKLALSNLTTKRGPVDELFPALSYFLKHYTYLQGTQGNHKKVFTATCNLLLDPVLQLRYLLSTPAPPSVVTEVIGHLDEILSSLFTCDTLVEFTSAVSETGKGSAAVSYARALFERLEKLLEPSTKHEGTYQAAVVGVAAIYQAFLAQNSKERQVSRGVEFQFFSKLLRLLGCDVGCSPTNQLEELEPAEGDRSEEDRAVSAGAAAEEWGSVLSQLCSQRSDRHQGPSDDQEGGAEMRGHGGGATRRHEEVADATGLSPEVLATLSECLGLLLEYGVYQAAEDDTAGGSQSSRLQLLSVTLLKGVSRSNLNGVFACLHAVLKLNHKILEPLLPALLVIVIARQHQTFSQGMNLFTREVLDVYFKLRQFPLLLKKLLSALETVYDLRLSLSPSPPLTPQAEHRLGRYIQELPPGQCIEILETLCQVFEDTYFSRMKLLPASGPPRKKKKKRDRPAPPVNASTTGVHSESLAAVTRQFVDLFATVVSHVPLEVWSGRYKGRALTVLRKMREEICQPFLDACPSIGQSLCSASLHLTVKCTELEVGLQSMFPDLLHSDSLVTLSWQPSLGRMLPANWDGLIEGPLDSQCEYLMRKLAVLQLRFSLGDGEIAPSRSELLGFVFQAAFPLVLTGTVWSGQLLAISDDNAHVASWSLLLSQLPLLYEQCSDTHLKKVAGFILQTVLAVHDETSAEADRNTTQVLAEEELNCGIIVGVLVNSTGFQEMRRLHELLPESCFSHSASTFPKRFPRELKEVLMQCATEVTEPSPESLHTAFVSILRQFSEQPDSAGHPSLKKSKRIRKWLNQLSAYRELMQTLPLAAMRTGIIQRGLLAVAVYCASLTHVMHLNPTDFLPPTLASMQYLLAWLLHSLTRCSKDSKSSQKALGICSSIPVDAILQWAYTVGRYHYKSSGGKDSAVLASSLVVVEMVFKIGLQYGNYPSKFVKLIGSEVRSAVKRKESYRDSLLAEECLRVAVNHTCKTLSELSPKHQHVETLRAALDQLLETILKILERISDYGPYSFPAIVSAFVTILHCRRGLVTARSAELASVLLLQAQSVDTVGQESAASTAVRLEKLFAMVDALSLPAAISKNAVELKLPQELALLPSWYRLQQILEFLLEKVGYQHGVLTLVEKQSGSCPFVFGRMAGRETKEVAGTIIAKVTRTMSQLLAAASREEIASVFELVSEQDFKSAVSVSVFCCCWNVILDSRLSQDSRRELRRWLTKVLLKCMSVMHLYQSNAVVLFKAVCLAARLVAIPSQVGLDSRSVMMSLHLCSSLVSCSETEVVELGDSIAQLLSAVVRNHTVVAGSCPAPIISTVNKLIDVAVKEGQAIQTQLLDSQNESAPESNIDLSLRINSAIQFAGQTARVMEVVSNLKVFTKYATYPIGEFIVGSSTLPVHASIKKALLPGVFSLLKLCSEQDTAFIQATLDASMQDTFKTVLAEYKKFHKFSGRI